MVKKLSPKQQAFVDVYDGNATEAAKIAGYKGNEKTLSVVGSENLAKPYIWAAIQARDAEIKSNRIATREERQAFWTDTMRKEEFDLKDRIRASELLGKSQCDFIEKKEITGANGGPIKTESEILAQILDEIDGATRGLVDD